MTKYPKAAGAALYVEHAIQLGFRLEVLMEHLGVNIGKGHPG